MGGGGRGGRSVLVPGPVGRPGPEFGDSAVAGRNRPGAGRSPADRGTGGGPGQAQSFSHAEQASSASDDEELAAALAEGNRAYEEKFGRIFLIRAAGRSRPEILAELRRRLELDPAEEPQQVGAELRDIALIRIPQLFSHLDSHSGYDESEAAR